MLCRPTAVRPHSPLQHSENSSRDGMAREEERIAKGGLERWLNVAGGGGGAGGAGGGGGGGVWNLLDKYGD